MTAGGIAACSCGSGALILSTVSMTLAPGCLKTSSRTPRLPLAQAASCVFSGAVDGLADVADAHRRAVAIGDDDVVPGGGLEQLVVVVDREAARRAVDAALGRVDVVALAMHAAHVLEREAERGELRRVDLDADRRLLLAADADLADAGDLADLLRQHGVGVVVDLGQRQHVGGQRR